MKFFFCAAQGQLPVFSISAHPKLFPCKQNNVFTHGKHEIAVEGGVYWFESLPIYCIHVQSFDIPYQVWLWMQCYFPFNETFTLWEMLTTAHLKQVVFGIYRTFISCNVVKAMLLKNFELILNYSQQTVMGIGLIFFSCLCRK